MRKSRTGELRFAAKARFTSLPRFHGGGKLLARRGAQQILSLEEARENKPLALFLAMQKLGVIEPISRGAQRFTGRFIEAQGLLERTRGIRDGSRALLGFGGVRERKALQGSVTQLCGKLRGGSITMNRLAELPGSGIRIRNIYERRNHRGPFVTMLLGVLGDNLEIGAIVARGGLDFALLGERLCQIQLGIGLRRIDIDSTLPVIRGLRVVTQAMCQKTLVHQRIHVIG